MGNSRHQFASDSYLSKRTTLNAATGCLEWRLSKVKGGYGKVSLDGKTLIAHRAIWEARVGQIPENKVLCHRCDNPACVNVNHLFLGTHKENSEDMVSKGRQAKGATIKTSKLTESTVRLLRQTPGPHREVARVFGLKPGVVRQIRVGETWRHLL